MKRYLIATIVVLACVAVVQTVRVSKANAEAKWASISARAANEAASIHESDLKTEKDNLHKVLDQYQKWNALMIHACYSTGGDRRPCKMAEESNFDAITAKAVADAEEEGTAATILLQPIPNASPCAPASPNVDGSVAQWRVMSQMWRGVTMKAAEVINKMHEAEIGVCATSSTTDSSFVDFCETARKSDTFKVVQTMKAAMELK